MAIGFAYSPDSQPRKSVKMPGKAAKIQVTERQFEILEEIVASRTQGNRSSCPFCETGFAMTWSDLVVVLHEQVDQAL